MKHLVIVQSRFDSYRLPGKSLYPFYGTTVLGFLLKRLTSLLTTDFQTILATTELPSDDITTHWGSTHQTPVVRGPVDDVLSRFLLCLEQHPNVTTVTRVTADNPFTSPQIIMQSVHELLSANGDYIYPTGTPLGVSADTFGIDTLRKLDQQAVTAAHREHINGYLLEHPEQFKTCKQSVEQPSQATPSMTIDTLEHWKRLSALDLPSLDPWCVAYDVAAAQLDS